jgi:hypothetical protein
MRAVAEDGDAPCAQLGGGGVLRAYLFQRARHAGKIRLIGHKASRLSLNANPAKLGKLAGFRTSVRGSRSGGVAEARYDHRPAVVGR